MKQILTLKFAFIVSIILSVRTTSYAQHGYPVTYQLEILAPATIEVTDYDKPADTVTSIDPVTRREEVKIVRTTKTVSSGNRPLFDKEQDASRFRDSLLAGIENGSIKAYASLNDRTALSAADAKKRFLIVDTVTAINPVTLHEDTKIVRGSRVPDAIRFYEDWAMDKTGNMAKRIKGYTLLIKAYDSTGQHPVFNEIVTIKTAAK